MDTSKILDGVTLSSVILDKVKQQVEEIKQQDRSPSLAVIILGDNPASLIYINHKIKACEQIGINSQLFRLAIDTTEQQLIELIEELNADINIDAILVQLPLPEHIDKSKILNIIAANKDVDGFHRDNMGNLLLGLEAIYPCTVLGVLALLDSINLDYTMSNIVIVGRSNIVGKPLAVALINKGATVTSCNSHTKDLAKITSTAEVIIIATGVAKLLTSQHVASNAIVIDVGINTVNGKLIGDADFENLIDKVRYITPVPGGVGPMTIAMLMQNTLKCYLLKHPPRLAL